MRTLPPLSVLIRCPSKCWHSRYFCDAKLQSYSSQFDASQKVGENPHKDTGVHFFPWPASGNTGLAVARLRAGQQQLHALFSAFHAVLALFILFTCPNVTQLLVNILNEQRTVHRVQTERRFVTCF